jgi:hypothetical protein
MDGQTTCLAMGLCRAWRALTPMPADELYAVRQAVAGSRRDFEDVRDVERAAHVLHEAVHIKPRGQAVDKRPKADPLDDATNRYRAAYHG